MSKTLPAVDAVIVGGGWTGSIVGKELAAHGARAVVLERGQPRWPSPDFQAPAVHDELKYTRRHALHQDTAVETFTFRNRTDQTALPMRRWQFAYPTTHLGGAGNHWSGACYRFDPTDLKLRSHYTQRYGAGIFDADLAAQDWPLNYDELEPFYDRFDYLIGASGFAGNLKGQRQPGGNPFEPWRSRPYPNPPMKVPFASALFGTAAASLGYHPYIRPSALSTRPYVNSEGLPMSACVYCGFCSNFGCEHFAKASPQVCILVGATTPACATCHAPGAPAPQPLPRLEGMPAEYAVKELLDFRRGTRPSPVMGAIAKGLTDGDIASIARYYASQPRAPIGPIGPLPGAGPAATLHALGDNADVSAHPHPAYAPFRRTGLRAACAARARRAVCVPAPPASVPPRAALRARCSRNGRAGCRPAAAGPARAARP